MKAILAGFGKYYRESCQTNSHGPMKFHYCQTDPLCLSANCSPKFSDGIKEQGSVESYLRVQYFLPITGNKIDSSTLNLKNYTGCVKSERTPAMWSKLCSK